MSQDEKYEQLRQVCVSYRNDCEKLEKKVSDLEAKLAEEKEYTQQYRKECAKIQTDYYELKEQLETCESELQNCMYTIEDLESENGKLLSQLGTDKNIIKPLQEQNEIVLKKLELIVSDNKDLQKALAEKDEEIEKWKQNVKDTLNAYSDEFVEKDKELKELRYNVKKHNQDKIKLLENIKEIISFKPPMQTYEEIIKTFMFRIDDKIKEIKGE